MPCGKKRKRHKIATHKRKKSLLSTKLTCPALGGTGVSVDWLFAARISLHPHHYCNLSLRIHCTDYWQPVFTALRSFIYVSCNEQRTDY